MNRLEAIKVFHKFDKQGKYVFHIHDMAKLFPNDSPKALHEGLGRLTRSGLLKRACRGVYVNENAASFDGHVIEHIAKAMRRGYYNYVSLESILSEYGEISQIPIDRLTVMTTGKSGTIKTPYGVIEFTHTKRTVGNILKNTLIVNSRPIRVATKEAGLRDLRRVGRNTDLLDQAA